VRKLYSLSVLLIFVLVLSACSKKLAADSGEADTAATPVQVAVAAKQPLNQIITAEAVLFPVKQANINPKISAPVQRSCSYGGTARRSRR
jgi:multidrug efflux pump subunit AcrA (membrane-fusion protein)